MARKKALTVNRFEELPWSQLLIRCQVKDLPQETLRPKAGLETTIVLYCATQDYDHNQFFIEIGYSSKDPRRSLREGVGLDIRLLGQSPEIRHPVIGELLDSWRRFHPEWASTAKPVFACSGSDGFREIPATSLHLMQHFACLQQRVAYEVQDNRAPSWMFDIVYHRLGSFIQDRREDWARIVG